MHKFSCHRAFSKKKLPTPLLLQRKDFSHWKLFNNKMPISAKCRHEIFDECTLDDNLSTFHSAFLINKALFVCWLLINDDNNDTAHTNSYAHIVSSKSIKLITLQLSGKKIFLAPASQLCVSFHPSFWEPQADNNVPNYFLIIIKSNMIRVGKFQFHKFMKLGLKKIIYFELKFLRKGQKNWNPRCYAQAQFHHNI